MKRSLLILIISTITYSSAISQSVIGNKIQQNTQLINSGKPDEAIANLEVLLKENPTHPGIYRTMGLAYRMKKNYSESLVNYSKCIELQPESVQNLFQLGVAYALADKIDESFAALLEVKQSNQFNLTNIGLSPAASILQSDSRYKELFPSTKEYANPFDEEVEIIHDWKGEFSNDQFGWIARNIGDVNKDGIMDITASAPTNNEGTANGGKIYVFSGKSGELIWEYIYKNGNGQLGMSIEAAGDVNNDGIPDVVAGAPYANKVLVFSGDNGDILFEWNGNDEKGAFGRGVRGVGDVNRDGYSDVLIGEPFQIWGSPLNSDQITHAGNVYLYSGQDGSILQSWTGETVGDGFGTALGGKTTDGKSVLMVGAPGMQGGGQVYVYINMDSKPFFIISPDSTSNRLGGMFMSVVGDVNGDGIQDVYASDFSNMAKGFSTGRAFIHSGKDGERLLTITGENAGDGFGIGVADAGDTNGDGYDDLVIGSWQFAQSAPSGGKVYVYSGIDGTVLRTITSNVMGETLGFDTTGIGDVNGDGKIDLLLTSAWSAINGTRSGRMLVVAGN